MAKPEVNDLESWIRLLQEGKSEALDALLHGVQVRIDVEGTKARLHCYALTLDGNDVPRSSALAEKLARRVVDYAIPRSERENATQQAILEKTYEPITKLVQKAARLFSPSDTTGEPGEVLIYLFAETYLKVPQLLCKMPLKTNANVHVHGIDGLHVGFDAATQRLCLYWAESKLKADFSDATKECLEDLKPFVCSDPTRPDARDRDLQLARDHLDDGLPEAIEDALLQYLDPQSSSFRQTAHRGICVIGFDHTCYPEKPNTGSMQMVTAEIEKALTRWTRSVKERLGALTPMDSIELEVFLVPLPSVQTIRDEFVKAVRNAPR